MARNRDTGERMDALLRGADWAQMGTSGAVAELPFATQETEVHDLHGLQSGR